MIAERRWYLLSLTVAAGIAACGTDDDPPPTRSEVVAENAASAMAPASLPADPSVFGDPGQHLSSEQLEQGRLDRGWQRYVQLDSAPGDSIAEWTESWEDISAEALSNAPMTLPIRGDVSGPSVIRLQIALDRAVFSPGIIDGRWGKNTEKALYWFQKREGLPATGELDRTTWERLQQVGRAGNFARSYTVTADDVAGPFTQIPEDIYEKAELDCMCYESLSEMLAERFHTSPAVLAQLNPQVNLDGLTAGQTISVPAVRDSMGPSLGHVARLRISDGGYYLHALDASGNILAHFPATLGAEYDPSPQGEFTVTQIAQDPTWHYQPSILATVDSSDPEAIIQAGPNNAVGVVWMQLSEPHFGIHGTNAPESIGYTTSHGCVRLTNWDARYLSHQIEEGVDVEFRDVA